MSTYVGFMLLVAGAAAIQHARGRSVKFVHLLVLTVVVAASFYSLSSIS